MTNKEVHLLVKLLNMTNSENDFEALVAIRKCNSLLKKYNKSWTDMYKPQVPNPRAMNWTHAQADFFRQYTRRS